MNRLPVDTSRSGWIVFLQLLHTVRAPCGIDPCGYGSTMTHWLHVEILDHPSCCLLQFDISKHGMYDKKSAARFAPFTQRRMDDFLRVPMCRS